jgi:nucleoside-diphosphate-sugar epimerase
MAQADRVVTAQRRMARPAERRRFGGDMARPRGLLVTGASGYLGSLIVATLLRHETARLLTPVRGTPDSVLAPVGAELATEGADSALLQLGRLEIPRLPPADELDRLLPTMREFGVDEVIHCAACLDYFNRPELEAVNIELTRRVVALAQKARVRRFVYISTAFSSGYIDTAVPEELHAEPPNDPTDYTRTKRMAEHLVASSGLPYLIIRPSIVIGDSRDGHYSGKRYGLYQLWSGIERLLCREWQPEMHIFAPSRARTNLVHQDAFQSAFLAAYRLLPDNTILNLVSDDDMAPSSRQLWDTWFDACNRPRRRIYYERMADIPMHAIPRAQRALLALASVNLNIISHDWSFDTGGLATLRSRGLDFPDATLDSVLVCQRQFIDQSATIQRFLGQIREPSMPVEAAAP